jgi:O-antigen/teichoic acid export membrane protein
MTDLENTAGPMSTGVRARFERLFFAVWTILKAADDGARAKRMALVAFAIRIISAAIAFVSQIILARLMGEFEYGIMVFVWVFVVIIGNLSCLGFHTAQIRFLPGYHESQSYAEARGMAVTARIFAMVSASVLAIVGVTFLHYFGNVVESYYVVPLFLGCIILPMIALGDILEGTARANSWPINALGPTFVVRPLLILIFIVVAITAGAEHTAIVALTCSMAATYVTTICQFLVISWRLRRRYQPGPVNIDFVHWFKVAIPIFLIEGFGFLLTNSDVMVVGFYLQPEQVAIYFAAAKTIALVQFVYFSVKAASGPRFSSMIATGNRRDLALFAGEMVRWSFWPSLIVGLCVLLAGKVLLGLFGSAFVDGYGIMAVLFVGILAKGTVGPGESLLTMAGEQKRCVGIYAVALVTNVSLNIILIPLLGLYGAALATTSAIIVEASLLHISVRQKLGIVMFVFANPLTILNTASADIK